MNVSPNLEPININLPKDMIYSRVLLGVDRVQTLDNTNLKSELKDIATKLISNSTYSIIQSASTSGVKSEYSKTDSGTNDAFSYVDIQRRNWSKEDFENKYLRAHAEMQNIQRRANEERQLLQRYRSQDLAKAILPSLDNLERALAVEGLTDDVKKGLEMVQESLIHALKEEGIEEIAADGAFDHNYHMAIQTLPADDEHPADTIAQVFQKGYKLHDRILRPAMVVVYN